MTAKPKPLSAAMVACIDDAAVAGELIRYQGGFWAPRHASRDLDGIPRPFHGSSTVQALVSRGAAEYTEWRDGRAGSFPIAMRLKALEAPHG